MKIAAIINFLEGLAPLAYQEEYDNSGLIVGRSDDEVNAALISLDCTEAVVDEAIGTGCQLIISHHPIVFKGLKKFNQATYLERVVEKAIRNKIAIYAIHTNLDNIAKGVNARICSVLGLSNSRILAPKSNLLKKLITFVPQSHADVVREALFNAGTGNIGNYYEVSFNIQGVGTFKGNENTTPHVGEPGKRHYEDEVRIESIYPAIYENRIINALINTHPNEEVAYDLISLTNKNQQVGSGMIGEFETEITEVDFMKLLKERMQLQVIRHTDFINKPIKKVAVCGGAGGFLLKQAIAAGADAFVTADYKYHEFFDAEGKILVCDIGHFESEQFTQQLLFEIISNKFTTFAVRLTTINTNPVKYYI